MQLVKRGINRDGSGFVVLRPEEPEDMVCASLSGDCVTGFDKNSGMPTIWFVQQIC